MLQGIGPRDAVSYMQQELSELGEADQKIEFKGVDNFKRLLGKKVEKDKYD